jgi:magnesium chelatase family protein
MSSPPASLSSPDKNLFDCVYPWPCGYYGDAVKACTCSAGTVTKYLHRFAMPASSGPLLDRIDSKRSGHIEVPRVEADQERPYEKLSDSRLGEPSSAIRARVEAARQRQRERFDVGAKQPYPEDNPTRNGASPPASPIQSNADMVGKEHRCPAEVRQFCAQDDTCRALMRTAMSQLQLSARAYHRILKLARTIADLAESEAIGPAHLAEARQCRPRVLMG